MPFTAVLRGLRAQVPKSNGAVAAAGCQLTPVGAEIDAQHGLCVARDGCRAPRDGAHSKYGLRLVHNSQHGLYGDLVRLEVGAKFAPELLFLDEEGVRLALLLLEEAV